MNFIKKCGNIKLKGKTNFFYSLILKFERRKIMQKKWYKKWWGIILIILCPYLLFIVIWQSGLTKKKKIILTSVLASFVLLITYIGILLEPTPERKIAEERKKQEELIRVEEERKKTEELQAKQEEERKRRELEEEKQRELEAQRQKQLEEEKRKKEKEEYMNAEQPDYVAISRYPDEFKNKKVSFHGQVIDIVEQNPTFVKFRMYVTKNCSQYSCLWDDDILVTFYQKRKMNILEDDILTVYGDFEDIHTYETVLGASRSIPKVNAKYIELN